MNHQNQKKQIQLLQNSMKNKTSVLQCSNFGLLSNSFLYLSHNFNTELI